MESREKSFINVKVNQLTKSDQELAYANHIDNFKKRKQKPDKFEDFLNEKVSSTFSFAEAKEGHRYWFTTLEEIVRIENRKLLYKKESKLVEAKMVLFFIMVFICFITLLVTVFYLFSIFFNL